MKMRLWFSVIGMIGFLLLPCQARVEPDHEIRAALVDWERAISETSSDFNPESMATLGEAVRKLSRRDSLYPEWRQRLFLAAQDKVLSIPGHAQYFADQLAKARKQTEKPWMDVYYELAIQQVSETMIHLPSPESIWVLGNMLESEEDLLSNDEIAALWRKTKEAGGPIIGIPSPRGIAGGVLRKIGLRDFPEYRSDQWKEAPLEWWHPIKSGELAFSFEGQAVEYRFRPDGTWETIPIANPTGALATPPQSVRRERAEKGRITPEAPQSTPINGTFRTVMMVISVLIIGAVAWLWKVRRARLD